VPQCNSRKRVFSVRQRNVDQFGARGLKPAPLAPELFDLRVHAVETIFSGYADLSCLYGFSDRGS